MTAILTTLLLALPAGSDDPTPRTRSHNLHSEILLTLHTNNIISEAIKKFGISNTTSAVLIVRFGDGEQEEVWNAMDNVVEGELAPLSTLDGGELVDWKALDKVCPDTVPFALAYLVLCTRPRIWCSQSTADGRSTSCPS